MFIVKIVRGMEKCVVILILVSFILFIPFYFYIFSILKVAVKKNINSETSSVRVCSTVRQPHNASSVGLNQQLPIYQMFHKPFHFMPIWFLSFEFGIYSVCCGFFPIFSIYLVVWLWLVVWTISSFIRYFSVRNFEISNFVPIRISIQSIFIQHSLSVPFDSIYL